MTDYRIVGLGLLTAAAACALAACGSAADTAATAPVTSTAASAGGGAAAPSDSGAIGETGRSSGAGRSAADQLATGACRTWATGMNQDAATRSTTLGAAAGQASRAAAQDAKWQRLSKEMRFLSSLPETGNSAADQRQAITDEQDLGAECRGLGVNAGN